MDIERLLSDYHIPYVTEGHKHSTQGWVNIHCPFCAGSQDFHLGISNDHGGGHCWRCGGHSSLFILSKVLNLPPSKVKAILQRYQTNITARRVQEAQVTIHPFKYPKPFSKLSAPYKKYLESRGFDADYLEQEWGLLQTGPVSYLDGIPYGHRIIIPIEWDEDVVSFQARDITDRSTLKYLACPKRREKVHLKNILYGKQQAWDSLDSIIIVEGVTDVWRLGRCSAAVFGIEFKMEQVLALRKYDAKFFILFDDEPQAQIKAREFAIKLKALGKRTEIIKIKGDPGSMKQDDADHLVRQLTGGAKWILHKR